MGRLLALSLLLGAAQGSVAQELEPGRLLYQTHCGACHYERVHQRIRSDVKDLADLRDTVARWTKETKHRFTLDEIEEVVQYLNRSHYRFGLKREDPPAR